MFNALDPGGEVLLSWPELFLGRGVAASGKTTQLVSVQWRNATSSLTQIRPMGEYTLVLQQGSSNNIALALVRSEEHTSELQSLMRISYAVFCLKKKKITSTNTMKKTLIKIHKCMT